MQGIHNITRRLEELLENLQKILLKIHKDKPTLNELSRWASAEFKTKEWVKNALEDNVICMSLATRKEGNRLYLTEEGKKFLDTGDKEILLNLFCKNIWGAKEMLLWLKEQPMTSKELFEKFRSIGASWKKGYQVEYRLLWLRALEVVDKSGQKYILTSYGMKFVESLETPLEVRKEPSHNEVVNMLIELGETLGFYVKREESIPSKRRRCDVTWRSREKSSEPPDKVFEVALSIERIRDALSKLEHVAKLWRPYQLYIVVADEENVKKAEDLMEDLWTISRTYKPRVVSWTDIKAVYECWKTKKDLVKELSSRLPS
ncbi:MAG: hypothetical protein P3X22_001330 [Thermoprotei archaeon]|nr:hypothetical protein [Thermoprotei archaeon]